MPMSVFVIYIFNQIGMTQHLLERTILCLIIWA